MRDRQVLAVDPAKNVMRWLLPSLGASETQPHVSLASNPLSPTFWSSRCGFHVSYKLLGF